MNYELIIKYLIEIIELQDYLSYPRYDPVAEKKDEERILFLKNELLNEGLEI